MLAVVLITMISTACMSPDDPKRLVINLKRDQWQPPPPPPPASSRLKVELPPVSEPPSSSVNEAVLHEGTTRSTENVAKETSYEAQLRKTSELFYVGIHTGAHITNLAGTPAIREATLTLLSEDFKVRKEKLSKAISPKDPATMDKSFNSLHAAQWNDSAFGNPTPQEPPQYMGKKLGEVL